MIHFYSTILSDSISTLMNPIPIHIAVVVVHYIVYYLFSYYSTSFHIVEKLMLGESII